MNDASPPLAPRRQPGQSPPVYLAEAACKAESVICLDVKRKTYLVHHPDAIKHVLVDNHLGYRQRTPKRPLMGHRSLTMSSGDTWRQSRRLMQPIFHPRRLDRAAPHVLDATSAMLERWQPKAAAGEALDVASEMVDLGLEALIATLFGPDGAADGELKHQVEVAFAYFDARIRRGGRALPLFIPTPGNLRIKRALRTLKAMVKQILGERRRKAADMGDLLSTLIQAEDPKTQATFDDDQLVDELMMLLVMGHRTTAMALTWTWALLARHPSVEKQLATEVSSVLGDRPPGVADLDRLPFTRQVIDEVLRLYPSTWTLSRGALNDDVIAGFHIPAGSTILISPYATHRHPELWPSPEQFDPERFAPERRAERRPFAYLPFGGGPRACVASGLALMEIPLVVARVAQCYRLDLLPEQTVEMMAAITLEPRGGLPMSLHKRAPLSPPVQTS